MADGGISQFAHRKLRELLVTPMLLTEHVRGLEARVDFMVNGATDFVRGDVQYMGITATMKLAHAAEGLGLDIEMPQSGPGPAPVHGRHSEHQLLRAVRLPAEGAECQLHPVYADDYVDQLDAAVDGHFPVPQGPGLGVVYDWEKIRRNSLGTKVFE